MSEMVIMTVIKKALIAGIMVAGPILIVSLLVGLIISIFQATTQIQEQTLTFVPKLIVIILVLVIGGPWMLNKLVILTTELFNMVSTITK
ncbi:MULTISPECIES: flagellar biosynthesis protein FliQ [Clostridium]|uniref:Flagellar biosynthetic protein FliQ n=1 Tax=Clostridium cadaveris TaxID=1529 RepID=A0A1I2M1K5_9CLOT|nr:flagellar biosynthesis protein FliQ [Clostridium cadaveris]MDU4950841.1 flagellar biosynthesis protein FliQ [Clostridium sp.]MDM8312343.1 flagellar biosynthesis protein FliQ [Clostridium cadaveris]MDY4948509.1 flagellar biosynthesis protein FliQ [Clostridium cadaveris]NME63755.1 flagellar biosynthesis protein FliQ [Clostridium cadaveris]SFF83306.1 flagellar biosynthetic protein FliQ [Clostridium cadaveris]